MYQKSGELGILYSKPMGKRKSANKRYYFDVLVRPATNQTILLIPIYALGELLTDRVLPL